MSGFIKIHKQITNWEWYTDANTCRLFIHLLIHANFRSKKWKGLEIMTGQLVTGRKSLSKELNLSEQQIRTALVKLESTGEITIKPTNRFSVVTICKWENYQGITERDQPTKQPTMQPTINQQLTTLEEGKEIKNRKSMKKQTFSPPSISEIKSYFSEKIKEKGSLLIPEIEAEKFETFYGSKDWMIGKNKMTDWRKAVSGWIVRAPKTRIETRINDNIPNLKPQKIQAI